MKKHVLFVLLALVFIGLLFEGCSTKQEFVVIGGVGPASGEASTFGVSTRRGMQLAVEEWNSKGGVLGKQVKLVFEDDKGDPTEAATVYTKLISQDKVVGIVGTIMSKCSLAGAPICQANGVPMVSQGSTNPMVTEVGDYIFRVCFIDPFQGTVGANFAYRDLGIRKAGVIFDNGNDYTKGLAEFFRDQFLNLGGEIVAFEGHVTGTTDFKAQLTKIINAGAELIYIPDYYDNAGLITREARDLGFTGSFLGGDGWDSPDLVKIGGESVEGAYFTGHFSKDDPRPEVQEFVAKYKEKYGETPDSFAAFSYDATNLLLDAIKRAGTTEGAALRDAIKDSNFQGAVGGAIVFDENRNPIKAAVIIEIRNGQQVYKTTVNP